MGFEDVVGGSFDSGNANDGGNASNGDASSLADAAGDAGSDVSDAGDAVNSIDTVDLSGLDMDGQKKDEGSNALLWGLGLGAAVLGLVVASKKGWF